MGDLPFRRITDPLLDTLACVLQARQPLTSVEIVKRVKRSDATTFQQLVRLRDAKWVDTWWETEAEMRSRGVDPERARPNRMYQIAGHARPLAVQLLAERRPAGGKVGRGRSLAADGLLATVARAFRLSVGW